MHGESPLRGSDGRPSRRREWFNQRFERRGHFWGGRFGSNLLADTDAVMDTMIYVELNAVRAGLVDSPELWEFGLLIDTRERGN